MKDESKKTSAERACVTCGAAHTGQFGSGMFCSSSCSRVVGAKARWRRHRTSAHDDGGIGTGVEVCAADSCGTLGLHGETVVVRDGKTVVRGCIVGYDATTDRHRVEKKDGKYRTFCLRRCRVEFDDDDEDED